MVLLLRRIHISNSFDILSRITSYINNLHPRKDKPLYHLMEKLIDASIPQWDLTLAPLKSPDFTHQLRITYTSVDYKEDTQEGQKSVEGEDNHEDNSEDDSDNEDNHSEDTDSEDWDTQSVIRPEPEAPFAPLPSPPQFSLREEYGKRGLQVIVKLANIELTPEKPQYDGGSWHIEGQLVTTCTVAARQVYSV